MPGFADILIENARVFTADAAQPFAEALAVQGERLLFVGGRAEAQAFRGPGTRLVDAGGGTLMPGFIDGHFHLLHGALHLGRMQLEPALDYEQLSASILAYAAEHPNEPWLAGVGVRYNLGPGHTCLNRRHLDALIADRPILLNAYDGHTFWANTLALQMAGIFHGGDCGPNSVIVLDEAGEATGELREFAAAKPVNDLIPMIDEARWRSLVQQALALAASLGVTSIHNMNGNPEQAAFFNALAEAGELTCRISLAYSFSPETPLAALQEALALKQTYVSSLLRAGCVKLFMDGVIEGYTGLLLAPYADDSAVCGAANYAPAHFNQIVAEADRLGLQVAVHAVGDGGVRQVLDAYENAQRQNGRRDARHRIEHIELAHPADWPRFRALGVLASMQPLHAPPCFDEHDLWLAHAGRARWPYSFAWQSLRQAGATLVFGSDWPVVTQNPLHGVSNALNRRPWDEGLPDQRQSLADTLTAYTRDAAFAEFQEHCKGQLKAGRLADLVLFPQDLFAAPPSALAALQPCLTMLGGRIVYEA